MPWVNHWPLLILFSAVQLVYPLFLHVRRTWVLPMETRWWSSIGSQEETIHWPPLWWFLLASNIITLQECRQPTGASWASFRQNGICAMQLSGTPYQQALVNGRISWCSRGEFHHRVGHVSTNWQMVKLMGGFLQGEAWTSHLSRTSEVSSGSGRTLDGRFGRRGWCCLWTGKFSDHWKHWKLITDK